MATVVDALTVELGLDTSELVRKQGPATEALKKIEAGAGKTEKETAKVTKANKDAAKSFEALSRTLTTFLTLIGGTVAIRAFIDDFINANAQLDRLSKNLGLSVETISAWGQASEKLGGSASGLQGTLDMLSKAQTQLMLTGESNLIPYFAALGVNIADVGGKARPVTDILLDLSDRFSHLDRTTANNLGRMLGLDQGTLNLLLQGRKEVELQIKRAKEQTAVTKEQAAAAQKFQTQIVGLKQQFSALGRSLFMEAAPYLEKFLDLLQKFTDWAQSHQQFIEAFLKAMAVGLAAIALATVPIDLMVVAILGLAAGIALLYDDYQTWKRGGDSLIDWGQWKPGIDHAVEGIHEVRDAIKELFSWIVKLHDAIPDSWARALMELGESSKRRYLGATGGLTPEGLGNRSLGLTGGDNLVNRFLLGQRSSSGGGSTAQQAAALAQQVSQKTGVPANIILADWQFETGNFTNRGARELNNLAGINVPGGRGEDYRKFASLNEFADYYAALISKYQGIGSVQNSDQFAAILKANGYYTANESQYAAGLRRYGGDYAASVAAASPGSSPGSIDRSVNTDIQQLTVNTQATDANGIVRDIEHSMDFLFTAQANSGMN